MRPLHPQRDIITFYSQLNLQIMKANEFLVKIKEEVERFNNSANIKDTEKQRIEKSEASANIEDFVNDYNHYVKIDIYNALMENDNPMLAAIKEIVIPVLRIRDIKDVDGIVTKKSTEDENGNLNLVNKRIDLLDFDKYSNFSIANEKGWQYKVERFNQLMCLKVALELGLTKGEMNEISKTFYLSKMAEKIEQGKTPTSNTQALKELQSVIDAIIFEDNGNGKNKYKANSHDIAYLDRCIAKRGRSLLTVSVVNSRITRELVAEILNRIVTDKKYDVEYRKNKVK